MSEPGKGKTSVPFHPGSLVTVGGLGPYIVVGRASWPAAPDPDEAGCTVQRIDGGTDRIERRRVPWEAITAGPRCLVLPHVAQPRATSRNPAPEGYPSESA